MNLLRKIAAAAASIALLGCTTAPAPGPHRAQVQAAPATQPFVIAANPLAAEAGLEVLSRGGSAVDAAVAVQAMLSLVEPQSSGLGGGAFINHYEASTRKLTIYDGRETAPAQATSTMFLQPDGSSDPVQGSGRFRPGDGRAGRGRGAGNGATRIMASSPGRPCSEAAQRTASQGFAVSPRLARFIHGSFPQASVPDARSYFSKPDGSLLKAGETLRNPAYAEFLGRLAAQGPAAFYTGSTAARIVEKTRAGPLGGSMTMADLASYRPVRRDALCRPWRVYLLCVPPPPSSGVGLIQLMKLLETTDIAEARAGRPALLVPVRAGEPDHVRRPRPLCRRPGFHRRAGRGAARPRLYRAASEAHRHQRGPAPEGRSAGRRAGRGC
jgi:gamma-glutamyltranspeptidase / glutathione hydrolase